MAKIDLTIPIQWDEDKLRQLVEQAVERLKAEGYIWRDTPVLPDTPSPSKCGETIKYGE